MLEHIQLKLDNNYSPDAVTGELHKEEVSSINTQTVYNYISMGILAYKNYNKRKCKQKNKALKRLSLKNIRGRSIEERPFSSEIREYGHWKMDTVVSGKGGKGCLLVLIERASRFNFITKLDSKNQDNIIKALDILEKQYKDKFQYIFKSITVDNGVEFLNMYGLEKSIYSDDRRTTIYHAHPFSSYEMGSNENSNKLIRKFIKKGSNIKRFSHKYIKNIQD